MAEADLAILFLRDLTAIFAVYLIVTTSLNMEYGYTGIPNFGKVLAFAGGAFSAGFFPGRLLSGLFGLDRGIDAYVGNSLLANCVRDYSFRKPQVLIALKYIEDNVVV